jgi:hypothetical protein
MPLDLRDIGFNVFLCGFREFCYFLNPFQLRLDFDFTAIRKRKFHGSLQQPFSDFNIFDFTIFKEIALYKLPHKAKPMKMQAILGNDDEKMFHAQYCKWADQEKKQNLEGYLGIKKANQGIRRIDIFINVLLHFNLVHYSAQSFKIGLEIKYFGLACRFSYG